MSLSHKQKMYLHEMGITLWSKRVMNSDDKTEQPTYELLSFSAESLATSALFSDILHAIGSSLGECTITEKSISFDFFSWSFSSSNAIEWHNNQLITPAINVIAQSIELKKQLWQHLSTLSIKAQ